MLGDVDRVSNFASKSGQLQKQLLCTAAILLMLGRCVSLLTTAWCLRANRLCAKECDWGYLAKSKSTRKQRSTDPVQYIAASMQCWEFTSSPKYPDNLLPPPVKQTQQSGRFGTSSKTSDNLSQYFEVSRCIQSQVGPVGTILGILEDVHQHLILLPEPRFLLCCQCNRIFDLNHCNIQKHYRHLNHLKRRTQIQGVSEGYTLAFLILQNC